MSYIKYGSYDFRAQSGCPVPQVSIVTEQDRNGAGKAIGSRSVITLEGLIFSSSGSFTQLTVQESGLRSAFSRDGLLLSIGCTGAGGSTSTPPFFSGIAKVNRFSTDKTENYWVNTIGYTIELQVDSTGNLSNEIFAVTSTQDEFNIETMDELAFVSGSTSPNSSIPGNIHPNGALPLSALFLGNGFLYPQYRVSRTLSAVGKFIPTGSGGSGISAVENAKKWVRFYASGTPFSGIINGLNLYNFTRSISVNEPEGSYRITDNWIASSGSGFYTDSFTAEGSVDNTMLKTVAINGTIRGLELFNSGNTVLYNSALSGGISGSVYPTQSGARSGGSKFDNAISGYNIIKSGIYNRARCFIASGTGISGPNQLNPIPVSVTEGYNPAEGSISYSWTFNSRPINIISGSISENLTVNDTLPTQQVAELFVLGRRLGPVIQDLGTITSPTREVTFEVVMPRPSSISGFRLNNNQYRAITGVVESFNPTYLLATSPGTTPSIVPFVKGDAETWNISEGRFVKTKSWTWMRCT